MAGRFFRSECGGVAIAGRQDRIDSLVLAFEQASSQKTRRVGGQSLTEEERIGLAVEALEREVNNGGYGQFFSNSSREFAPIIVGALRRIRCTKIAIITQKAIKALGVSDLRSDAIEASIGRPNKARDAELNACDDSYYKSAEPVAERLFAFIKANNASIRYLLAGHVLRCALDPGGVAQKSYGVFAIAAVCWHCPKLFFTDATSNSSMPLLPLCSFPEIARCSLGVTGSPFN